MELIQPAEISGKIMTLIDQAKEELIIVSPYNKVTYWKKLVQRIEKAKQRNVRIRWYIRKNVENNAEQIRGIGIEPIEIENLHCKIYLNEQNAVVTSMNLHEFSDSSSIDIGYFIAEKAKYSELIEFIDLHIDSCVFKGDKIVDKSTCKMIANTVKDFNTCIKSFFLDSGFSSDALKVSNNEYGVIVNIRDFADKAELILEPKRLYYRIDLRFNYPYKTKNTIYKFFEERGDELNKLIGFEINFGNQMKRLKIDLKIFENYDYENWSVKEFNILKPILLKVMETYKSYINDAIYNIK